MLEFTIQASASVSLWQTIKMTCLFQGYVKFVDLRGDNTHRLNHTGYISLLVVRGVSTSWIHEMFQTRLQDEHICRTAQAQHEKTSY